MSGVETLSIQVQKGEAPEPVVQPDPVRPEPQSQDRSLKLSAKERFSLLEQFGTLIDSGIQIPAALQSLLGQASQPRIASVLARLEQTVLTGHPLSEAMSKLPRAFPALITQMVRAGEKAGDLPGMLRRTVEMLETEAELRSKLRSAMIYPVAMVLLTLSVVVFLLTAIVPKFESFFRGKEASLPGPTQWLMAMGDFLSSYWVWVLAGVAAVTIALVLFARTATGRVYWDKILLNLPVAGPIYRMAILGRSARTMGLLIQSGVRVHVALEYARDVAGSPTYESFWQRTRQHVVNGGTMTEAIRNTSLVTPTFKQIVSAGESTATLDGVMLKTAAQYRRDLERKIRDLLTMIEPMMVVAMGGVVGFVALSIMLPIFRMSRA